MHAGRWTRPCAYRDSSKNNAARMLRLVLVCLGTNSWVYSFSTQEDSNALCLGKHIAVAEDVECEIKDSENGSCRISLLDKNSCYAAYNECKGAYVEYRETPSIRGTNLSDILFENLTETSTIVMTTRNPRNNWLLETNNTKEVKLVGLNGTMDLKNNPRIFKTEHCTGCPLPKIEWYPLPKLHKMYFRIPGNVHDPILGEHWAVTLYSSNKTDFTTNDNCIYYAIDEEYKVVNGSVRKGLSIDNIYSTEFCFIIHFTAPQNNRTYKYSCGRRFAMTEPPDDPRHLDIPVPTWWIFVLATMLLILLIATVIVSTCKGRLRLCLSHLLSRTSPSDTFNVVLESTTKDVSTASPTEDARELQLFLPMESPISNGRTRNGASVTSVSSNHCESHTERELAAN